MRSLYLLLFIGLCGSNFACSKQISSQHSLQFETREEALKVLNGDQVTCDTGDCPEAVGALYIMHKITPKTNGYTYEMNLCSATLVNSQQILTNRHCFDGIAGEGQDFQAQGVRLQVKFPAVNGYGFQSVSGKRIVKMSTRGARIMTPDWALVELDAPVARKPSEIASLAFNDEIQVTQPPVQLFPVYFDKSYKPTLGRIKSVNCSLKLNDNYNVFSFTGDNPLFKVDQCSSVLVKGNSGSGLFLKENAKLLGVMALSGEESTPVAHGTMASCVPSLNGNSRSCFFSEDEIYGRVANTLSFASDTYRSYVLPISRSLNRSQYPAFRWQDIPVAARLQNVEVEWIAPWQSMSTYLQQKNADRLRRQLDLALLRVYFPNLPSCVMESAVTPSMALPLVKINWMSIYGYEGNQIVWRQWREVTGADGSSHFQNTTWGRQDPQWVTVDVKSKKESSFVTFEGEVNNLLEPLRKFKLKLPVCR